METHWQPPLGCPGLTVRRWELKLGHHALRWCWAGQSQWACVLQQKQFWGYSFYPSARNPHLLKLTGSCSAETAVEEKAPPAQPPDCKATCTGKIQACKPEEGITHHRLQAVESGAVLSISETKLQVSEATCTTKDIHIDGCRLRKLLNRRILCVSHGLTAS